MDSISSMTSNGSSFFASNKTYIIGGIIGFLFFLVIGYFLYFRSSSSSDTTNYHANREQMSKSDGNKKANILFFSAQWCPHCQKAKPEWENFKGEYEGKVINGYTLVFTDYDCTEETPENEAIMKKYNIEGFPTVKLIKDNQIIDFDANVKKDTLQQFVNSVL